MSDRPDHIVSNHHESIDDLRRDLMSASMMWQARADALFPVIENADTATEVEKIALTSSLMAANYSYVLAAVLGIAQAQSPDAFAKHLAFEIDEMLNNGDDEDYNSDVTTGESSVQTTPSVEATTPDSSQ